MLHPYQDASKTIVSCGVSADNKPARALLSMLGQVNEWLGGVTPYVQSTLLKKAVSVYILYRNVAYTASDLWDEFACEMAQIHRVWPICAFGTARNHETIKLTATAQGDQIHLLQQSISGKSTQLLQTLCFQVDCADNDTAALLVRMLTATHWETQIIAMRNWKDADFLRTQAMLVAREPQGLFCYASVRTGVSVRELLFSLDFEQKIILWTAFLKDGFDCAEFEWIAEEIANGTLDNRLEWELALLEALDQLEFHIVNGPKSFELCNAAGRRVYFGADGGCPAQRVFLKILFPLND